MQMSNHQKFHVVYDGPALANHRMDVRDLAPALVAIADLFTAANKAINGDAAEARVEVHASFKVGSFGIDLVAAQHLLTQIREIFTGKDAAAIANAAGILSAVGFTGSGLIWLLRRLQGKQPVRIEQYGEVAQVWITETESVSVANDVIHLYRSRIVRTSLEKTLSPLERDGIDQFGVVLRDDVVLDIQANEIESFRSGIDNEEIVSDDISRKMLLIESLTFKDGNKWRVHDGAHQFCATIDDVDFLAKIDAGRRFGKGDVLVVDLRQIQKVAGAKLTTAFHIVKVIEHKAPLQAALL